MIYVNTIIQLYNDYLQRLKEQYFLKIKIIKIIYF